MKTLQQIIKDSDKEFDKKWWNILNLTDESKYKEIKSFLHSHTQKILEAVLKEIIEMIEEMEGKVQNYVEPGFGYDMALQDLKKKLKVK